MKMDWLKLESRIREALKEYKKSIEETGEMNEAHNTLLKISEIIGYETGRGYILDYVEGEEK